MEGIWQRLHHGQEIHCLATSMLYNALHALGAPQSLSPQDRADVKIPMCATSPQRKRGKSIRHRMKHKSDDKGMTNVILKQLLLCCCEWFKHTLSGTAITPTTYGQGVTQATPPSARRFHSAQNSGCSKFCFPPPKTNPSSLLPSARGRRLPQMREEHAD